MKKVLLAKIFGGLGNQLFQYSFARHLAVTYHFELIFDLTFFSTRKGYGLFRLNHFQTKYGIAHHEEIAKFQVVDISAYLPRVVRRVFRDKLYLNKKYRVSESSWDKEKAKLNKTDNIYLFGYWNDQKYFIDSEDLIRKELVLSESFSRKELKLVHDMQKQNSVSLHVRRGDYIDNSSFVNLGLDYYQQAIDLIASKLSSPKFFIFSDDLSWSQENLNIKYPHEFVIGQATEKDYIDLVLMSKCNHNVIANSTFSWWGAWLNCNPKKCIIAPSKWFKPGKAQISYEQGAIVPDSWIKI